MGETLLAEPSGLAMSKYPALASTYKGNLLSACPTTNGVQKVSEKKKAKCSNNTDNNQSFICGIVKKPWGSNVVIEEKTRVIKRVSSKDSAIGKHRAWLKEMQDKREKAEHDRVEQERSKKERLEEFMAKQAAKRAAILDNLTQKDEGFDDNRTLSGSKSKPVWAMTEGAAQVATEEAEAKEEEDLLCFVESLNFDQYSHDMELSILMSQVKERIRTLQKEKSMEETRLQAVVDSESAAMKAENLASSIKDDLLDGELEEINDDRWKGDDDIMSIADTVRSESSSIGSIHSQKSMQALIARSKENIDTNSNAGRLTSLETIAERQMMETTMTPPVLITHTNDDGARIAETKSINKLPFMNRNPAL